MDNREEYFLKPTQHFQSHWHQPFLIILFTWEAGVGWGEGGIPVVSYFIFCYRYMPCPWSWTLGYISVSIYTQMSKDTTYTHKMLQSVEIQFLNSMLQDTGYWFVCVLSKLNFDIYIHTHIHLYKIWGSLKKIKKSARKPKEPNNI